MTPVPLPSAPPRVEFGSPAPRRAIDGLRRSAARRATTMSLLRRVHLYSGLFLLPWVLIYGISAFLFNRAGPAATTRELGVVGATAAALPDRSGELGARLLTAVGAANRADTCAVRGTWTFEFRDSGRAFRLAVPIDGADARVTERPARTVSTSLPSAVFEPERLAAERVARDTLAGAGLAAEGLRLVEAPSLAVTRGDRRWATTLSRDTVSEGPLEEFALGRLLRRLHVTHGYGSSDLARIAWAVIVDAMAFAMVTWSLSGLAMWWQKRSLRVAGAAVLGAALLLGVGLVIALQTGFSN